MATAGVSPTGTVGVSTGEDVNLGASYNPFTGTAQAGVSGGDEDLHGGVGVSSAGGGTAGVSVGGGNEDVQVGVAAGVNSSGFGVAPTVQFGQGQGNSGGAQIGGAIGTAIGGYFAGPVGAAAGSAIGSAAGSLIGGGFNKSQKSEEGNKRDSVINAFKDIGLWNKDYSFLFPDGSLWQFDIDAGEGIHDWKNPGMRSDNVGDRPLYNYESDYTSDMDYAAAMAGTTLSRLLAGTKNKQIDQIGQMMGNAFLGKQGYGAEFNEKNFGGLVLNARSMYGRAGIQTKEDMLAIANKAFADGRISDTDYAVAQQTASMIFDNDFKLAQSLMAGRGKGVETASKTPTENTPSTANRNRPGRIYSPIISPEEALLSVQPYFDFYRKNYPINRSSSRGGASSIVQGVGAAASIFQMLNRLSGGALSKEAKEIIASIGEALGIKDPAGGSSGGDASGGGYDLGGEENYDLGEEVPFDYGAGSGGDIPSGDANYDPGADADYDLGSGGLDFGSGGEVADYGGGGDYDLGDSSLDF